MQGVTLFRTQNSNQRHLKGQPEISGLRRRSDWRWQWLCKSIPTFNDWWQQMIFSILKDNDSTAHWRSADRNTNKKDNLWKPQTKKDIRWSNNRVSSLFLIWLRFVNFFRPPSFNQGPERTILAKPDSAFLTMRLRWKGATSVGLGYLSQVLPQKCLFSSRRGL